MSISAQEARRLSESTNEERNNQMFGKLDSMIDQTIYEGGFSVTTPTLNKALAKAVIEHYSDLGYEIHDYNNNMYGINW